MTGHLASFRCLLRHSTRKASSARPFFSSRAVSPFSDRALTIAVLSPQEGALLQLQASHVTCGVELGILLVEALTTDEVTPDLTTVQPLLDIIAAFPRSGA